MGLLDRWSKKGKEKQLEAVEDSAANVVSAKKQDSKAPSQSKKKKVTKSDLNKKSSKVVKKKLDQSQKTKKTSKGEAYRILKRPVVSEKAAMAEANGVYTFVVANDANKPNIKKAIKQVYGVIPKKVRIINVEGKKVRFGRQFGRRSDWKKAIITLAKNQSINIHEGV